MTTSRRTPDTTRQKVGTWFLTVLTGLAIKEMVAPIRESVRLSGLTWDIAVFPFVFLLTAGRFFIGNHAVLMDHDTLGVRGLVWFYDLIFIIAECILLVFAGGVSSLSESQRAFFSFPVLLGALLVMDIVWIASQIGLHKWRPGWRRARIPREWAGLNAAIVLLIIVLSRFPGGFHSKPAVMGLAAIAVTAFVLDVVKLDLFNVLDTHYAPPDQSAVADAPSPRHREAEHGTQT